MKNFIAQKTKKSLEVMSKYLTREEQPIETAFYIESETPVQEVDESLWQEVALPYQWKRKKSYGAIKAEFTVPASMEGLPLEFRMRTGYEGMWDATNPQFSLYVNDAIYQGMDVNHTSARICDCAKAGDIFRFLLLGYLGDEAGAGGIAMSVASMNDTVKKLYFDLTVPYEVSQLFPEADETRLLLEQEINGALNLVDFRYPQSEAFFASVDLAIAYMEKFYNETCGKPAPTVHMIGHTHIDVAWLWPLCLTRLKSVFSFSTVNRLMEQYDEYTFMSSQPQLYEFVKEQNPKLYEIVKQRIQEGRWGAEGAMWLEADCNLSSGEGLVRQILFGKRFFAQEFGVDSRILWLPDVFGYSAALPQILKKSGVDYFMTSKISWNDTNKMPYDTFLWEGIDGTEILSYFLTTCDAGLPEEHFGTTYNGHCSPSSVKGTWERYQQKMINDQTLTLVGYGDGGGGTTPDMMERAIRMSKGIPGMPQLKFSTTKTFFETVEQNVADDPRLPKWVGELYLEYHRGTYSSMNQTKKYNRKSEILYQDAEFFSVLSKNAADTPYPQELLNRGWKTILLNQFHDILPGSSIKAVYDESYEQYAQITRDANEVIENALATTAKQIGLAQKSALVFNNLSYVRTDIAQLPEKCGVLCGGERLYTQMTHDGKCIFVAQDLPQKGYRAYAVCDYAEGTPVGSVIDTDGCVASIETDFYTVTFDQNGNLTGIFDRENDRQVLKPGETSMIEAYEDMPFEYDNWEISPYYAEKMWEINTADSVKLLENGPVRTVLRVEKPYYNSRVQYDVILYRHTRRIDFAFAIDWKENDMLLKFKLPVDILASEATYEIQYGNTRRNTHANTSWDAAKYEVCAHKWADVSESNYGVSMLNDCKYGHQIKEGNLRWTINKSTCYPNPEAGKDYQEFVLSLLPHAGADLRETIREAYFLNSQVRSIVQDAQAGNLPECYSLVQTDNEAVVVEVVKKAEDGEGVILRMYESTGGRQMANITLNLSCKEVLECDMMEQNGRQIAQGNTFAAQFMPFEIKTFLVI